MEGRKKRRRKADKDENEAKLPHISSYLSNSACALNEVTVPSTPADEYVINTLLSFCPRDTIAGTLMLMAVTTICNLNL